MPAQRDMRGRLGVGVRKPSGEETAGGRLGYGDLGGAADRADEGERLVSKWRGRSGPIENRGSGVIDRAWGAEAMAKARSASPGVRCPLRRRGVGDGEG